MSSRQDSLSVAQLLKLGDEEFESTIKDLPVQNLMETISTLQKEMTKEQENFNSLSADLQGRSKDRNSRQNKQISKDLMTSQQRLTLLMQRSMKCFNQQSVSATSQGQGSTNVKRRNSAKGPQPNIPTTPEKSTNIHRSKSLHSVNQDLASSHNPALTKNPNPNVNSSTTLTPNPNPYINSALTHSSNPNLNISTIPTPNGQQKYSSLSHKPIIVRTSREISSSGNANPPSALIQVNSKPVHQNISLSPEREISAPSQSTSVTFKPSVSQPVSSNAVLLRSSQTDSMSGPIAGRRREVSKSQILVPSPSSTFTGDYRGLPSVKRLAQSFGSTTALNTAGTSSETRKSTPDLAGNVHRSNSSVTIGDQKRTHLSQRNILYLKGNNSEAQGHPQTFKAQVNGNIVDQTVKNNDPKPSVVSISNKSNDILFSGQNKPNEIEAIRAKLKKNSVSREGNSYSLDKNTVGDTSRSDGKSLNETNSNSEAPQSARVSSYVKRKDKQNNRPSSIVTVNSVPNTSSQKPNDAPRAILNPTVSNNSKNLNPAEQKSRSSSFNDNQVVTTPTLEKVSIYTRENSSPVTTDTESKSTTSRGSSSGKFVKSAKTESTAKLSPLRRAQSRDGLSQTSGSSSPGGDAVSNRQSLLRQIQARRTDNEESGFQKMSKLSRSMPSLLFEDDVQGQGTKDDPIKSSVVLPESHTDRQDGAGGEDEEQDVVDGQPRMNLVSWDPKVVLSKLYELKLLEEVVEDISHQFVTMEGLMEKLPMNKKKATLLKTWKRRFFRAKDGWLYYFETSNHDNPSETIQLMGGTIHNLNNRILGIDDGRGRYLMVRCPTEREFGQWKVALESQTADNTKATYVRPCLISPPNKKKVLVVDLGSSAIRAGVLGEQASLPSVFMPSVLAVDKHTGQVIAVGADAYKPSIRIKSQLVFPIRPSNKVDQFNIEIQYMHAIFGHLSKELNIKLSDYWVMISTPQNLGDNLKAGIMRCLVDSLSVKGVCMVQQALLSLYSYNATSGIIVDIGHRIEILPIFEGSLIEGGVSRCPYGGQKVQESLTTSLLAQNYKFMSRIEQILVRYIMEQSCYVAGVYAQEEAWCRDQPKTIQKQINLDQFDLPSNSYRSVEHDLSRFKSPEGFFNVDMWEMDYPTLQKLIHQAIQSCPMDNRRHMWRAVFLSGGVTMLPGFAERLESELTKLAPPGVLVEVHAAPQRYHAAYVGACAVSLMPQFEGMAISKEEWAKEGAKSFRKWQAP